MRKVLFLFATTILIATGCGSGTGSNSIEALEEKLETSKAPEDAEALMAAYDKSIKANPDDFETNSRYLYRAASTMYRMNRFSTAADYLKRAITDYYPAENTGKVCELLAEVYGGKLEEPETANVILKAITVAFPNYENIKGVEAKLAADTTSYEQHLQQMASKMFNDSTGRLDFRMANKFINACELYALIAPKAEDNPVNLHRAAETARAKKSYDKAIELYQRIYNDYPESSRAPMALFLHAFTMDNDLKKFDEAKVLYESFLEKYPDNDFADDTQYQLDNLGKTGEELIKSFQKNQNQ